jgi:TetR/AcrR family transcriptional regulator
VSEIKIPRMHADERRTQLLITAFEVFSRKGYEGATTREIAVAAGVNEAVIFKHFPSKLALYRAVLDYVHQSSGFDQWVAELRELMARNDDQGIFRALAAKILEKHRNQGGCQRLWMFAALEGHEPGLAYARELTESAVHMLTEYIARRQQEGAFRDYNPRAILGLVAGAAAHYGMMTSMFGYPPEISDERVAELFARIMITGVKAPALAERA